MFVISMKIEFDNLFPNASRVGLRFYLNQSIVDPIHRLKLQQNNGDGVACGVGLT